MKRKKGGKGRKKKGDERKEKKGKEKYKRREKWGIEEKISKGKEKRKRWWRRTVRTVRTVELNLFKNCLHKCGFWYSHSIHIVPHPLKISKNKP